MFYFDASVKISNLKFVYAVILLYISVPVANLKPVPLLPFLTLSFPFLPSPSLPRPLSLFLLTFALPSVSVRDP